MTTPLYTVRQLRRIEEDAQVGLPAGELMQRAGTALARHIHRRSEHASVLIVCGPGNNGGDGYVCAACLRELGHAVRVIALAEPVAIDARAAMQRWTAAGGAVGHEFPPDEEFGLIVDAMFGIGMTRALAGVFLQTARWMAQHSDRVIAIDVPSGLDVDCGTWAGGVAGVRASETVTFLGAKPGLFTLEGVDACGRVQVDMLGVAAKASDGALLEPGAFADVLVPRTRNSHKGSFGAVSVIGGNVGMVGAALIAARAALRMGAGRVYVDCIGAPDMRLDPVQPELMFRATAELTDVDAMVAGCGLGTDQPARDALQRALEQKAALVIDADGFNLLAANPDLQDRVARRGGACVVTPHPLEAARLLGCQIADVQADRTAAARRIAERLRAIVVLKGAGSIVAIDRRYWINPTGSPALASAGSGDALAGMIGSLLAQGFRPEMATGAAVWLHGAAADEFGDDIGLAASDIAPLAARVLSRLRRSS